MNIRHRATAIRKDNKAEQEITYHETEYRAQWWTEDHYADTDGEYIYQIVPLVNNGDGHGWVSTETLLYKTLYIVDMRLVTETEWLKTLGLKSETV